MSSQTATKRMRNATANAFTPLGTEATTTVMRGPNATVALGSHAATRPLSGGDCDGFAGTGSARATRGVLGLPTFYVGRSLDAQLAAARLRARCRVEPRRELRRESRLRD